MALTDRGRFERWYGRPEPPLPIRTFSAGALELLVEGVDVRRVTYAGVPVMDRIFVAIRDIEWGTLPAIMDSTTDTVVDPVTGATVLTFRASHADASIGFSWQGRISVGPGPPCRWRWTVSRSGRSGMRGWASVHCCRPARWPGGRSGAAALVR